MYFNEVSGKYQIIMNNKIHISRSILFIHRLTNEL